MYNKGFVQCLYMTVNKLIIWRGIYKVIFNQENALKF